MAGSSTGTMQEQELLEAARGGDEDAFGRLVERYRGELHAHCYRMLGSLHDAEDAFQETLLRAWRGLVAVRGPQRAALLALHDRDEHLPQRDRETAEACAADRLRACNRPPRPARRAARRVGLGRAVPGRDARARGRLRRSRGAATSCGRASSWRSSQRFSIFPPNQRAVLILREVLGFSAKETAESLETTVASVNSALQRARAAVDERVPERDPAGDAALARRRRAA